MSKTLDSINLSKAEMTRLTQNGQYWKSRATELEQLSHDSAMETAKYMDDQFMIASKEIDSQIASWYQKFAINNNMTMAEAKKVLNTGELKEFHWTVEQYIKHGEELHLDDAWIKQMRNASASHHIERLEALKMEMQQTAEVLYGNHLDSLDRMARNITSESYLHETFNIQQGVGTGWKVNALDQSRLEKIISKPWTPDGKAFSDRIWENKAKMIDNLHTGLTQACITGKSPDKISKQFEHDLGVSKSNAMRLIQTEGSHFAAQGDLEAYTDCGVKEYQILATLDDRTSDICQDMDGQVFPLSEYSEGLTAPPFHPNCRSTTVPYFNDEFTQGEMRAARGADGKTYEVPADMTYKDWKSTVAKGTTPTPSTTQKIAQQVAVDTLMYPATLGGVSRGDPMEFDDANQGKANPKFKEGVAYQINCQTCVVSYEARRRGYDVAAIGNTKGTLCNTLARNTRLAWIDPETGAAPEYIQNQEANTPKKFKEFLEETIEEAKRYTMQFGWKGRGRSGHIIHVDRVDGKLRLYDPQSGMLFTKPEDIAMYLNRLKYNVTIYGTKYPSTPKLLRVDNMQFNLDIVDKILQGVK